MGWVVVNWAWRSLVGDPSWAGDAPNGREIASRRTRMYYGTRKVRPADLRATIRDLMTMPRFVYAEAPRAKDAEVVATTLGFDPEADRVEYNGCTAAPLLPFDDIALREPVWCLDGAPRVYYRVTREDQLPPNPQSPAAPRTPVDLYRDRADAVIAAIRAHGCGLERIVWKEAVGSTQTDELDTQGQYAPRWWQARGYEAVHCTASAAGEWLGESSMSRASRTDAFARLRLGSDRGAAGVFAAFGSRMEKLTLRFAMLLIASDLRTEFAVREVDAMVGRGPFNFMLASPDGLINMPDGRVYCVELKTPSSVLGINKVKPEYGVQAAMQAFLTRADGTFFVSIALYPLAKMLRGHALATAPDDLVAEARKCVTALLFSYDLGGEQMAVFVDGLFSFYAALHLGADTPPPIAPLPRLATGIRILDVPAAFLFLVAAETDATIARFRARAADGTIDADDRAMLTAWDDVETFLTAR